MSAARLHGRAVAVQWAYSPQNLRLDRKESVTANKSRSRCTRFLKYVLRFGDFELLFVRYSAPQRVNIDGSLSWQLRNTNALIGS